MSEQDLRDDANGAQAIGMICRYRAKQIPRRYGMPIAGCFDPVRFGQWFGL